MYLAQKLKRRKAKTMELDDETRKMTNGLYNAPYAARGSLYKYTLSRKCRGNQAHNTIPQDLLACAARVTQLLYHRDFGRTITNTPTAKKRGWLLNASFPQELYKEPYV